jgi:hypothetical protein
VRKPAEQHHRLVGDPVLREVEVEAGAFGPQPLAALWVGGEEVAQAGVAELLEVGLQISPGPSLSKRAHSCSFWSLDRQKEQVTRP